MRSLWQESEVKDFKEDPLSLRVYTSRLLGKEPSLVLHGGGNTSVKATVQNIFGESEEILYVKGSGWDLATIEKEGFAPVRLDVLKKMAELEKLSDPDMVKFQRAAMIDPGAPNPSVEAILHAIIPFAYVDHTHADTVITISNNPKGEERIKEIYGDSVIIVPYVMPGFVLAKKIYEVTKGIDWKKYKGMILLNHGVFSFGDTAKSSYENMIDLVTQAEDYLEKEGALQSIQKISPKDLTEEDCLELAVIRKKVSELKGSPVIAKLGSSDEAVGFSNLSNVSEIATRGCLTPDHVIRTKRFPVVLNGNVDESIQSFSDNYFQYFERQKDNARGNTTSGLTCLDPAPRFAIWQEKGIIGFGSSNKDAQIVLDISEHTLQSIQWGEALGGWKALDEGDLFDMEYWVLEQAKIAKKGKPAPFQGKVVLVTGAARGIGKACVETFLGQGAAIIALDINPKIKETFENSNVLPLICDVTKEEQIQKCLIEGVKNFGGLDVVISNAGIFPSGEKIADLKPETWNLSMAVNLSSHQQLLQKCIPFLRLGIDPAVVIVASKNVPAPGPGASAYSVAKAGLTQLARVAALELGADGIRVNVIHPNQVFDTGVWTKEVLENRAKFYNLSVEEYKTNNLLKKEITSQDVATLATTMAGPVFSKTTGTQVTIDGGNDRVI